MSPHTAEQIRACFVNTSKGKAAKATLPDLDTLDWERLEYLGWRDPKLEMTSYLVLELDGQLRGVVLTRTKEPAARRRKMCVLCEDLITTDDVSPYSAALAGPAGRRGNTIGTFICTDFTCSTNVRRPPTYEAGGVDEASRQLIVDRRIAGLQERVARFVMQVLER